MEKIRVTPEISTLLPNQKFNCEFKNCNQVFSTISNLNMHVLRSHQSKKLEKKKDSNKYLFHCPVEGCKFHEKYEENPKTFTNLKYLKNHYQNIHLARNVRCNKCEKDFITDGRLKAHLKVCGVTFKCPLCDIPYNSSIALYIHNKRKHPDSLKKDRRSGKKRVPEEISRSPPAQHFIILDFKHPSKDQETQTEDDETPSHTETQTDINSTSSILEDLLYSNTYTQTGPPGLDYLHMQTQTEDWSNSISSQTMSTNLLNPDTTDIQTQTNWFSMQNLNNFDLTGGSNNILEQLQRHREHRRTVSVYWNPDQLHSVSLGLLHGHRRREWLFWSRIYNCWNANWKFPGWTFEEWRSWRRSYTFVISV